MIKKTVAAMLFFAILLAAVPVLADEQFRIASIETKENGNVLVRWEDPSDTGPYYVLLQYMKGSESFSMQLVERNIWSKEIEISNIAPGEKYYILVHD